MAWSSGNAQCPQNDIGITTTTWWIDQTIDMCEGQRIVVSNGATLVISNSTVRMRTGEAGPWQGIVLQNGASLRIVQNSTVRDANEAIRGLNGFNSIWVFNSTITNVGSVVYASSFNPASGFPIYLAYSTLSNRSNANPLCIGGNGVNIYINTCEISNQDYNSQTNVGVDGFGNRLRIINSYIHGFRRCINKGVGWDADHMGLVMQGSDISAYTNYYLSVHNSDMAVSGFNCIFTGLVNHSGRAQGSWERNNFEDIVNLGNPELSHTFYENRFGVRLYLQGAQNLTDARCDFWDNAGYAVNGNAATIKMRWGKPTIASGNSHSSGITPIMKISASNQIFNHFYTANNLQVFNYEEDFMGAEEQDPFICQQRWRFTVGLMEGDTAVYVDNDNEDLWQDHFDAYESIEEELENMYPDTDTLLLSELEDARVGMGQAVLQAILHSESLSQNSYSNWMSRADPFLNVRAEIMDLFVGQEFEDLSDYILELDLDGDEAEDRDNFKDVVSWMNEAIGQSKDLYDLSAGDLEDLTELASITYGNYTAVIRGWLSINYQIYIDPPEPEELKTSPKHKSKSSEAYEYTFIPVQQNGNLKLVFDGLESESLIRIIDLFGRIKYEAKQKSQKQLNIPIKLEPGIYLIQTTNIQTQKVLNKSILIK